MIRFMLLSILAFLLVCCNDSREESGPHPEKETGNGAEEVRSDNAGVYPSDTQVRIEPAELKKYLPRHFAGFEVTSVTGGASESSTGRWTNAAVTFRKKSVSFTLRIYDWGTTGNYPESALLHTPPSEPGMESKRIADGARMGYALWSGETGSGQINILYYGRFSVFIQASLTDIEYERFMDLINEIDFKEMYNKVKS